MPPLYPVPRVASLLGALLVALLPVPGAAGQQAPPLVSVRTVLHDPLNPVAELYLPDQNGQGVKVELVPGGLSKPVVVRTVNGSLMFFNKAAVDVKNPAAGLAASAAVGDTIKRVMVVLVPNKPDASPAYRIVLIDDGPGVFPGGESRVLNMLPAETAIEAGEHKLRLRSGTVTRVPAVTKVNEFNMAQTNFYQQENGIWQPFTERQLQFLNGLRRIFLVSVQPGSAQPVVTTVLDGPPPAP